MLTVPVILYSFGYRLSPEDWDVVRAGGLSVSSTPSIGTKIFVDGKLRKEPSLLSRRMFVQGLTPRKYRIRIEKDGYFAWEKTLPVRPERVTDVHALLIKDGAEGELLLQGNYVSFSFTDTSQRYLTLADAKKRVSYYSLDDTRLVPQLLNTATTTVQLSSQARKFIEERKIKKFDYDSSQERIVWWDDKQRIWVGWLRTEAFLPLYTEENEAFIYRSPEILRVVYFYPNQEAILVASSNSVMTIELDGRDKRNTYPLYKGKAPELTVSNVKNTAYVLDDGNLIEIPLL